MPGCVSANRSVASIGPTGILTGGSAVLAAVPEGVRTGAWATTGASVGGTALFWSRLRTALAINVERRSLKISSAEPVAGGGT